MLARTLTRLPTAYILTLAVAGAVTAVAAQRGAPRDHPAQAPAAGAQEWHRVDLESFAVWLPPGWVYVEGAHPNHVVGTFVGDGAELGFSFGQDTYPLTAPYSPGYLTLHETIGGKEARLMVAQAAPADQTGVYFRDVARHRVGCDEVVIESLTVNGVDLTPAQQTTALAIYRSIHFPGLGEWTAVTVPTSPGTESLGLWDIDMVSADEGWAVGWQWHPEDGEQAAVLHYRDGRWRALPSPAEDTLRAIDMVSADEGWAVGGWSIVHYAENAWTLVEPAAPGILLDVEMVAPDDGWIVSYETLLRYVDGEWQVQAEPEHWGASRLNMLSPDDGWSLGGDRISDTGLPHLNRFDNGAWRSEPWPLPSLTNPQALEMASSPWGTGWLGGPGWLARHCEDHFVPITATVPSVVWDIDMLDTGGTEGWSVGGDGTREGPSLLMRFKDDQWTVLESPYDGYIQAIDMVSRDEGWAVGTFYSPDGRGGALLHYTGPTPPPAPDGTATPGTPASPMPETPTSTATAPDSVRIYVPVASKVVRALAGRTGGLAVLGDTVYLADGSYLSSVDLSDPLALWVTERIGHLGSAAR